MDITADDEENILTADGFDDAILGIGVRCGQPPIAVYDVKKVINILIERDGMTPDEAVEHFDFNIEGSWVGEQTPIWLYVPEED